MRNQLTGFFEKSGKTTHSFLAEVGKLSDLAKNFFYWTFVAPASGKRGLRKQSFFDQLTFMGNESLFIVILVAASVGAVLALQAAYQLKEFGAIMYTGALVSVSMTRELGPIVTAIVIAGRVGASITAELGTMKVSEEVDALTTMGIPPIPFLVVPRILAMIVMLPALTILSFAIGLFGGYLVGTFGLQLDGTLFLNNSLNALVPKDILTGVAKSFIFAILVGLISTYKGLSVHGGAEGVGRATTESVVLSIIAIIVSDCVSTAVFFYVF
jgi:phospholipid/cholesterol/gamma-HCH transport system permease protein